MEAGNLVAHVNYFAVAAAAVSAFVIGGLWYSPLLFGKLWQREAGLSDEALAQRSMGSVFGLSFLLTLVAAWALAIFLGPEPALAEALHTSLHVGLAWVATSFGVNYLFEKRGLALFLVNAGFNAVQFAVMGLILGAWH